MIVELTYFKESGKYYSEGKLEVPDTLPNAIGGLPAGHVTPLFEINTLVRHLSHARRLPGLVENHSAYHVLVNVPGHPHEHPHMVLNARFPDTWGGHFGFTKLTE